MMSFSNKNTSLKSRIGFGCVFVTFAIICFFILRAFVWNSDEEKLRKLFLQADEVIIRSSNGDKRSIEDEGQIDHLRTIFLRPLSPNNNLIDANIGANIKLVKNHEVLYEFVVFNGAYFEGKYLYGKLNPGEGKELDDLLMTNGLAPVCDTLLDSCYARCPKQIRPLFFSTTRMPDTDEVYLVLKKEFPFEEDRALALFSWGGYCMRYEDKEANVFYKVCREQLLRCKFENVVLGVDNARGVSAIHGFRAILGDVEVRRAWKAEIERMQPNVKDRLREVLLRKIGGKDGNVIELFDSES